MKQVSISVLVAAVVCLVAFRIEDALDRDDTGEASQPLSLSYTDELVEDSWVNGARSTGADRRSLAPASNSICYLTKIEIKGIQGPGDANSCSIAVDEFTGSWELTAAVEEGGQSEVRCNARCLVWEGAAR